MEKQTVFRRLDNRKVVREKIPVEGDVIIIRNDLKGYRRFPEFIGRVNGLKWLFLKDNTRIMVVNDRDAYPISPFRPSLEVMKAQCVTEGDSEMADKQGDYQLAKDNKEAKKNFLLSALSFAIIGIVFVTLIVILLYVKGSFIPKVA